MSLTSHKSAKPSHYDKGAKNYDLFNEKSSETINHTIENILKKYKAKTVLDLTCGTGSQVFWLTKKGFEVVGSDINANMLKIAKNKFSQKFKDLFYKGDMRTFKLRKKFDAVITIFNAIGHLTKKDFEKSIRNIYANLNDNGIYVFDIFNLSYLLKDNNITKLTIDWHQNIDKKIVRDIQYSTIDKNGTLASYTFSYTLNGSVKPKMTKSAQTLQVYTSQQLENMLTKNGFKVMGKYNIDGSKFSETKSERILIVAKKIGN